MAYFKDTHTYKAMILRRDKKINGRIFPANSIIIIDDYYNSFASNIDIFICEKFPIKYQGNNPILTLWSYNQYTGFWEKDVYKNKISKIMWNAYIKADRPQISKFYLTDKETENMMQAYRYCKNHNGSKIINNTINNPVNLKQVTQYAYWESLNNTRSGNASMVGTSIQF